MMVIFRHEDPCENIAPNKAHLEYAPRFLGIFRNFEFFRFDGESQPSHPPLPHSLRSGALRRREPLGSCIHVQLYKIKAK